MFCRKCGKEMKPNEKFCPSCGAKVETEETVQAGSPIQNAPQSVAVDSNGTGVVKKKPKRKVVLIAAAVIVVVIVLICAVTGGSSSSPFGKYSEEDMVTTIAVQTVRDQMSVKHDQDVYDVEILDTDGKYNYIVSATTESKQGFETWWVLLLKFDVDSGKYESYIHYHGEKDYDGEVGGDRFTKDNIPKYYKSNAKFGWGKENHIE